ncbi:plasmid partitioning/stability family protein [Erwinia persicina]|uniref:plasmid partitioning/stability family protein n=1 Tax=Erwinia persicina TaxID=55211 RepID=UPI00177CEE4C|nr:plasmid partitioning/stability family protein [Erwinia persicina]
MSDERKKFTLYLHPDKSADQQALSVIESVPRSARGDLYRNVFIAGLALQQLDDRLPALLTTLLNKEITADQLVGLIGHTTGWKPSQADIRAVIEELGPVMCSPPAADDDEDDAKAIEAVRSKLSGFL